MEISTKELSTAMSDILFAGLVPYIRSSPGLGKSSITKQLADSLNLELIDVRLAQMDTSDLLGFPTIQNGKTSFVPPDVFPISTDPLPVGKDGWLLFLDELSSASNAVAAAAYKLILDRKVGQFDLHSNVAIVAAGNKDTDKAIVNRMSTAMQSRLVHLNLILEPQDWFDWANVNKIDSRIISFLRFRPTLVHSFNPDHKDNTFPCPRTWEFTHKIINKVPEISLLHTKILSGTVGEGAAREFVAFTKIYESLPKIKDILDKPMDVVFTKAPDVMYAITGMIANEVNKANADQLAKFVDRLPLEFQIVTWVTSIQRNIEIYSLPAVKAWVTKNAKHVVF